MKKIFLSMGMAAIMLGMASCGSKTSTETAALAAKDTLDWVGVYSGVTPCADCSGIQTVLTLKDDSSYVLETTYLDESDTVYEISGKFSWNCCGNTIILDNEKENGFNTQYLLGESILTQLDSEGKTIDGELAEKYVLHKADPRLVNTDWSLTEIFGKTVADNPKEAYIRFDVNGTASGNTGCNGFHGNYSIGTGNLLKIAPLAVTRMMCLKANTETEFTQVVTRANNYEVLGDSTLVLKEAEEVLAKFIAK